MAISAIGLTTVLLAGALAFDAGIMFVERRDEQYAADAAAIAGARYLTDKSSTARLEAIDTARSHGQPSG